MQVDRWLIKVNEQPGLRLSLIHLKTIRPGHETEKEIMDSQPPDDAKHIVAGVAAGILAK
jgi:hypothetical protein